MKQHQGHCPLPARRGRTLPARQGCALPARQGHAVPARRGRTLPARRGCALPSPGSARVHSPSVARSHVSARQGPVLPALCGDRPRAALRSARGVAGIDFRWIFIARVSGHSLSSAGCFGFARPTCDQVKLACPEQIYRSVGLMPVVPLALIQTSVNIADRFRALV